MGIIKKYYNCITSEMKFAFLASVIIFIVAHGFYFSNIFPNHDMVLLGVYSESLGWMLTIGRWASTYVDKISSFFYLPWVIGVISCLYMSVVSCLIIDTFKIKNKLNIVILSSLIIINRFVSTTFGFTTYADIYLFSYILSILPYYIINKNDKRNVAWMFF